MTKKPRYTHETIALGSIYVPEGFYTQAELEELLAQFKRRDAALKKAMTTSCQELPNAK